MANEQQPGLSRLNAEAKTQVWEWLGIDPDSELLSPMVDYIFKLAFTADTTESKLALIDFINSALALNSVERIVELSVVNPEIPVESKRHKKAVFDIRVKFANGEQAIIDPGSNLNARKRAGIAHGLRAFPAKL